jgi:acetyl-CoA carboxylase biotin carboxyl carrier protein
MAGKKSTHSAEVSGRWQLKEIQELIDLLIDREVAEFEMEKDGMRVRILRRNSSPAAGQSASDPVSEPPAPAGEDAPVAPASHHERALTEPAANESAEGQHILKSPIVGTFYSATSPESPPFVVAGDIVQVGQVLCFIEAMKLMNEIEAEVAGEIVRVYAENGQPVEYGQPLFAIKPSETQSTA